MPTLIKQANSQGIAAAALIIKRGGLVAFPTETVYGLGANGLDASAVAGIYSAKGRPADNPLILHISTMNMVYELAEKVSGLELELMHAFWPGPLTIILPKKNCIPKIVSAGLDSVGLRMPSHPVAHALISAADLPIAAPSANSSGKPSPTLAAHVAQDLGGKIDLILDGGAADWGLESTVVEVRSDEICLLRPGAITAEQLLTFTDKLTQPVGTESPKAPGMKYTHYSPTADLRLVTGSVDAVTAYIKAETSAGAVGILATDQTLNQYDQNKNIVISLGSRESPKDQAANLFSCLREFDSRGVSLILAEAIDECGLGFAVMNRLRKAASLVVEV